VDGEVIVDFHDMHRLLQWKDLDVVQVTIFALSVNYKFDTNISL
jgi:hypothetical protein